MNHVTEFDDDRLTAAAPPALSGELMMLALPELHESPLNPRKYFAPKPLAELAESIRVSGVRVPLVARPRIDGPGHEIGAGHRRFRAAKMAGVSHVPVLVRDMSDAEFLKLLTFDNAQREDVNALEEAQGYQAYIENALVDKETVAAEAGKSISYVYGRLKLLESIPAAQRAFLDGKIRIAHLEDIARIPSRRDQERALKALEPANWDDPEAIMTTRQFKAWVKKNLHVDLTLAPFLREDAALLPAAGACTVCPHRLGNAPDFDESVDLAYMCTQRDCYDRKLVAHVNAEMARLRGEVVFVSEGWTTVEGVVPKRDWSEVHPSHVDGKDALIVEGPRMCARIRVVVQERIPAAPKPAPVPPQAPEWVDKGPGFLAAPARTQAEVDAEDAEWEEEAARARQEREATEKLRKAEESVRLEILRAILPRVKGPVRPYEALSLLHSDCMADLPDELDAVVAEAFGGEGAFFPAFSELPEQQQAQLLVLVALGEHFVYYNLSHGCDELHASATRYGVDWQAIRERAKESEGGTRRAVVAKLPTLAEKAKGAKAAKKAAPAKKAPAKKSAPKPTAKKAAVKKSAGKKGKGKK